MPDNIDLNRIREVYANMLDEEILHFARQEGLHITVDAFLLLRAELHKRNIGLELLKSLEHEMILQDVLVRKRIAEDLEVNDFTEAVEYSLTQKEEGASNYDIYAGLVELGIQEEQANHMVNKLDDWAEKLRKDAKDEIQAGVVTFVVGIIVFCIAFRIGYFFYVAALVPLVGVGRMIKGAIQKRKCENILETMKMEEERMNIRP